MLHLSLIPSDVHGRPPSRVVGMISSGGTPLLLWGFGIPGLVLSIQSHRVHSRPIIATQVGIRSMINGKHLLEFLKPILPLWYFLASSSEKWTKLFLCFSVAVELKKQWFRSCPELEQYCYFPCRVFKYFCPLGGRGSSDQPSCSQSGRTALAKHVTGRETLNSLDWLGSYLSRTQEIFYFWGLNSCVALNE